LTILFCPLFFQTIDVKQLVNLLNCKHRKGFASDGLKCNIEALCLKI
jgi:hypothetical protein